MGINIDETIRVLNVSIFGTPILINVCGYNLCVGKNIAKKIIVKTVLDNFKA
jgi:Fe2+ transport system protein FeoA